MERKPLRVAAVLIGLTVLGGAVWAQQLSQIPLSQAAEDLVGGEILVKFSPSVSLAEMTEVITSRDCTLMAESPFGAYVRVSVPAGQELEMAALFAADENCEWAAPNIRLYAVDDDDDSDSDSDSDGNLENLGEVPPDDPFFPLQTNLALINILDAWKEEVGDRDVVVAVLDTGVAFENRAIPPSELGNVLPGNTQYVLAPDLAETSFVPGFDFINGDPNANDDEFHGTYVTGVVAQSTNNGLGAAGTAPGITVMPVKVLGATGSGPLSALIDALNFIAATGVVDVANMSLSFAPVFSLPVFDSFFVGLDAALQAAHDAGIVLVASSGNDGIGVVSRPALNGNVIAVGASNFDGITLAGYSQSSTIEGINGIVGNVPGLPGNIEIVAPVGDFTDKDGNGVPDATIQQSMFTNDPDSFGFFLALGTSFSAPQVAAVAALILSDEDDDDDEARNGARVERVRQILRSSALDLGAAGVDLSFGAGQLDAAAAVADDDEDSD